MTDDRGTTPAATPGSNATVGPNTGVRDGDDATRYHAGAMTTRARDRSEALGRLADVAPQLRARGVASLRVFGSAGRDAMTDDSDVDILIEFDRPIGAFEFLDLQHELEEILGRPVDLVTTAAVKERMRPRIEREAVHAF